MRIPIHGVEMNPRRQLEIDPERKVGPWLLALVAWYATDYIMNVVNLTLNAVQLGRLGYMRTTFFTFVGDHIGWSHTLPYWLSLVCPIFIIAVFAMTRTSLTWQTALKTGLIIIAAQLVVGIVKNLGHLSEPWILLWYFERITVLAGPMVACLATRVDLVTDTKEA